MDTWTAHMGSVEREYLSHAACARKRWTSGTCSARWVPQERAQCTVPTLPKQTEKPPRKLCANLHSAHSHASAAHQSKQATGEMHAGRWQQETEHSATYPTHFPHNLSLVPATPLRWRTLTQTIYFEQSEKTPRWQRRANSGRNSTQSRVLMLSSRYRGAHPSPRGNAIHYRRG